MFSSWWNWIKFDCLPMMKNEIVAATEMYAVIKEHGGKKLTLWKFVFAIQNMCFTHVPVCETHHLQLIWWWWPDPPVVIFFPRCACCLDWLLLTDVMLQTRKLRSGNGERARIVICHWISEPSSLWRHKKTEMMTGAWSGKATACVPGAFVKLESQVSSVWRTSTGRPNDASWSVNRQARCRYLTKS